MHVKRDGFPVDALDLLSLQIHRDLQARVQIHPLPELVDHGGSEYHCREAEEYAGTFEFRSETRCNDDANPPRGEPTGCGGRPLPQTEIGARQQDGGSAIRLPIQNEF